MNPRSELPLAALRERVRCITFDLDDTLWECKPVIQRAERTFYDWLEKYHPEITTRYGYDELIQSRIAYMRENQHQAFDLTRLRKNWLKGIADECGADDSVVEEGFHIFWEARNRVDLFDGVRETLLLLKAHFILGSMTNGNADIHRVGLGDCFHFSVTSAEAGAAKPEKAIFELASAKAGIPLAETLHVGDDSDRDVIGALNSGAMAAWVTPEPQPEWPHPQRPHLVIPHVEELPRFLGVTEY